MHDVTYNNVFDDLHIVSNTHGNNFNMEKRLGNLDHSKQEYMRIGKNTDPINNAKTKHKL